MYSKSLEKLDTFCAYNLDKTDIVITFLAYPIKGERVRLGEEHSQFHWLSREAYNANVFNMNKTTKEQISAAYGLIRQDKRNQP